MKVFWELRPSKYSSPCIMLMNFKKILETDVKSVGDDEILGVDWLWSHASVNTIVLVSSMLFLEAATTRVFDHIKYIESRNPAHVYLVPESNRVRRRDYYNNKG